MNEYGIKKQDAHKVMVLTPAERESAHVKHCGSCLKDFYCTVIF